VGRRYDWFFLLLPPLMALGLGMAISESWLTQTSFEFAGKNITWAAFGIGIFIHAHIFVVFFRSHGNPEITDLYPWRFLLAPVLLYLALVSSLWILISVSVIATFWDVYHSGLQTFGIGRIYDRRAGNDARTCRNLDLWMNHLLYAGPILAGATMLEHANDLESFDEVGAVFLTSIPAFMEGHQRYFTWGVIAAGTIFLAYYVFSHWRMHKRGYEISWLKLYLFASTGACSIYTWGFNTWGEAFFIMNFFHAMQYFGIMWATEKHHMMQVFRVDGWRLGKPIAFTLFIGSGVAYGVFVQAVDTDIHFLWAITLVVSVMHFWYDGFIWSVQKRQV
jgi:hypothetical protein